MEILLIFYDKGWIGTLITILLTCIATFINVFVYKKLPILEGLAIMLYFFVVIALVRFIPDGNSVRILTESEDCCVLGNGGPWRDGGFHDIF